MSAMLITGPDTSSIALKVASRGLMPSSMWCSTASTTTIASSTTNPIASTSAKSDSVLIEKPSNGKTANVPINDTGTAIIGNTVGHCQRVRARRLKHGDDAGGLASEASDLLIILCAEFNPRYVLEPHD